MPADFFEFGDRNGRGDVVGKRQIEFGFDKLPRFHRLQSCVRRKYFLRKSHSHTVNSLISVYYNTPTGRLSNYGSKSFMLFWHR